MIRKSCSGGFPFSISAVAFWLLASPANADCTPNGSAHADTIVCNGANANPVDARSGNDDVTIPSGASVAVTTTESATAIDAGTGNDKVLNNGAVSINATVAAEDYPYIPFLTESDSPTSNSVTAVAIQGGNGDDAISNNGTVTATGTSTFDSVTPSVTLIGGDEVTATTTVESTAAAIATGHGANVISNDGTATANASSDVGSVSVELNLIDLSHADTTTYVRSNATGIDGRDSNQGLQLSNTGTVNATATSHSGSVGVEMNLIDAATADAALEIDSTATGVAGGHGLNRIENSGAIRATASSTETDVAVNIGYADLTIIDRQGSDTSTTLRSTATGIDGADGHNHVKITATGSIDATANSNVDSLGIGIGMEGVGQSTETLINDQKLADMSITGESNATGISTGKRDDVLTNLGNIAATATATADQDNIGIGISLFDIVIPTPNMGLVGGGTAATATATGIDAGNGDNWVANSGVLRSTATANADSRVFSINIGVYSVDLPGSPGGIPLGVTLIVADTETSATAQSRGIVTGTGADNIHNVGSVNAQATANGGAIGISGSANIEFEQGEKLFTLDTVFARAGTVGSATTVGIDAGEGQNAVINDGNVTANAGANATAVSASISVAGAVRGSGAIVGVAGSDTSATSTASATGIRGGGDDDGIRNNGGIVAGATADAIAGSGSLNVGITRQGLVLGAALARAESEATASATGIDGAGGDDNITNTGSVQATADADADSISVGVAVSGTKQGVAGGVALTDASATANATAIGIRHGDATDASSAHASKSKDEEKLNWTINTGTVSADAQADTLSVGASVNVNIATEGVVIGVSAADASVHANAVSKGIEGNATADNIANDGSLSVNSDASGVAVSASVTVAGTTRGFGAGVALTEASVNANANAIGIDGGAGNDELQNRGAINIQEADSTATAVGVSVSGVVAMRGAAIGGALSDTSATATTIATGIAGGDGADSITNDGTIDARNIEASADAVSVSLSASISRDGFAFGGALADGGASSGATAAGIDGGEGEDNILNRGRITLQNTQADATAVSVSLGIAGTQNGVSLGAALVDAEATADATAIGIAGGRANDRLRNAGPVEVLDVNADTNAVGVGVSATFSQQGVAVGAALARTGTTATATAKGMDGGVGADNIYSDGTIAVQRVNADADAVSVSVGLSGAQSGVAVAAGLVDASGNARANASAIDGGEDADALTSANTITVTDVNSSATAAGISVALSGSNSGVAAGVTLANTSATATTNAKGHDGGAGDDAIANLGNLSIARVGADADAISVGVSVSAAISGGVTAGVALSDASATAEANATGIDGGAGNDRLLNTAAITLTDIDADTTAVGVSAQLGITNAGVALGGALADTSATSRANATGMEGGAGDDKVENSGYVTLQNVRAEADAVSVAVTLSGAIQGGVAAGVALVDGQGTAEANAAAMSGGSGNDLLRNTGTLRVQNVEADAHATGVAVSLNASFAGVAAGAALTDTSATARTNAKGLDAGAGDDLIENRGGIEAQGGSTADGVSVSIGISGTIGVGAGLQMANVSTTAETTVMGVDGGTGRDEIWNENSVAATASAVADAASVGIGVTIAIGGDATLVDATSSATATAVGINDAANPTLAAASIEANAKRPDNFIYNAGAVSASATSTSEGMSISGNLLGFALGETSNTSTSQATGIRTHDTRDKVRNEGTISATGSASASGLSVAVTLGGAAMGDANTTATAAATGVDTGAGDDDIRNFVAINASARSDARANTVSVGLIGVSQADASTTAIAAATGIDAGSGNDEIRNSGSIVVSAGNPNVTDTGTGCNATAGGACARASSVSVNLAGAGFLDAATVARSTATGIAAGANDDVVESNGAIDATAHAKTGATGVNVNIAGAASTNVTTTASANAYGIRADDGKDVVYTRGVVNAASSSNVTISSTGVTIAGSGGVDATLAADARATAIDGGAGQDWIINEAALSASTSATMVSSGGSNVIFGASGANSQSGAITDSAGIRGGAGDDNVSNWANIDAHSSVHLSVNSSSFNFAGSGNAGGGLVASTRSTGIAGDAGRDQLFSQGNIVATASATLTSSGGSNVIFGSSSGGSSSGAITEAIGMDGGADDDQIRNAGSITANAASSLSTSSTSFNFGGSGGTQGSLTATTRTIGIAGGAGDDTIKSDGSIILNNTSSLTSSGGSTVAFGSSGATSQAGALVEANGIDGGDGADFLWNLGSIRINTTAGLSLNGSSYTFGGSGDVGGRLSATTRAVGMQGGAGTDFVSNESSIEIISRANVTSGGHVSTTFGTSASSGLVTNHIAIVGMDGGAGDDEVRNAGSINADAQATVGSNSSSYVFGGSSSNGTLATSVADATGMRGGDGNDVLYNSGNVRASAMATNSSSGSAYSEFGGAASVGEINGHVRALGMDVGGGDDSVVNTGSLTVIGGTAVSNSHNTDTGILFGGGDSRARASTSLDVLGIDLGEGNNAALNQGSIAVELFGGVIAGTSSDGADIADGDAFSRSDTLLTGTAIGIRAGGGNDNVVNTGSVEVKTSRPFSIFNLPSGATSNAWADGDGIDGDGTAHTFATTSIFTAGIDAGNGNNTVRNDGTITVDVRAFATASSDTDADAGGDNNRFGIASVTTPGYGIRTGNGDDTVINNGTINVSVRATSNTSAAHVSAGVSAIETGGGNDTITNAGTINATYNVNGSTYRGVAISSGAGDDIVRLLDGSVTNGDIDMGAGNDSLQLQGTPTINGSFVNVSSTVTLSFEAAGSYTGALPGVTAIKNGEGTFSLSMLNPMKHIEVNKGTLKLDNDYQLQSDGLFQAKVYGDGSNGQFFVNGDATLDGKMKVVRGEGAYKDGTTFDVLKTSGTFQSGSAFNEVELPQATPLLSFRTNGSQDTVQVQADVKSFTTVAKTDNEKSVAKHLDAILPTVTGELNRVLGEVQTLSGSQQFTTAFSSLSPAVYANYSAGSYDTMQQYATVVQDRMLALYESDLAPVQTAKRNEPIRLAFTGSSLSGLFQSNDDARERTRGVWLRGFTQKGDQDAEGGVNGYGYSMHGATLGYDVRLSNLFTAGFSIGTAKNDVTADRDMSDGNIDSTLLSVYGGYSNRTYYVTGVLSAGRNEYDTQRSIFGVATPVTSSHEGDIQALALSAGYYAKLGDWSMVPYASIQYTRLKEEGFTETGSGAGLNVAARTSDGLVSTVGARFSRVIEGAAGGSWIPQASVAWLHDFSDEHVINASYVGAPESTFSINGQPIKRNGALLGTGVSYRTKSGFVSSLSYTGELRDDFSAHGFIGELRYEF